MAEVKEKTCEICGKVISSLSEAQLEQNFKVHQLTHERKEIKEDK